jgi:HPt (histidine-containing phosphotransfer) domain-containing protein
MADAEPILDAARLEELAASTDGQGGNLLSALVEVLLAEEEPAAIAGFREALAAGDSTQFSRFAHRLKGTALIFGANRLAALCEAAEAGSAPAAPETLDAIEAEVSALKVALRERVQS